MLSQKFLFTFKFYLQLAALFHATDVCVGVWVEEEIFKEKILNYLKISIIAHFILLYQKIWKTVPNMNIHMIRSVLQMIIF